MVQCLEYTECAVYLHFESPRVDVNEKYLQYAFTLLKKIPVKYRAGSGSRDSSNTPLNKKKKLFIHTHDTFTILKRMPEHTYWRDKTQQIYCQI